MHRRAIVSLAFAVVTLLGVCGSSPLSVSGAKPKITFSVQNWAKLVADPKAYAGDPVNIVLQIFTDPQTASNGIIAYQGYADPARDNWATIVYTRVKGIESGDFVKVRGVVYGQFTGKNALGGSITDVTLVASHVTEASVLDAAPPAIRTVKLTSARDVQHDIVVRVTEVDFAASETRVFVTVANDSQTEASFYPFDAKAVQGDTQVSADDSSELLQYPAVETDLMPGVVSRGVLVLPAMNPSRATTIYLSAGSNDFTETFDPFVFQVPAK